MNLVVLCGNLTADPELRQSNSGVKYLQFSIAVTRRNAKKDGTREADFIVCTAFGAVAENISKYFRKGSKILLQGEWRADSYEQNGVRTYTNKMLVLSFTFVEKSGSVNPNQSLSVPYQQAQQAAQIRQDFNVPTIENVPDVDTDFGFSTEDDFGF